MIVSSAAVMIIIVYEYADEHKSDVCPSRFGILII